MAEDALGGGADVLHRARGIDHADDVARVADERLEPFIGRAQPIGDAGQKPAGSPLVAPQHQRGDKHPDGPARAHCQERLAAHPSRTSALPWPHLRSAPGSVGTLGRDIVA